MPAGRAQPAFRYACIGVAAAACVAAGTLARAALAPVTLPNGWTISPPSGAAVHTGTMPQGMAASPDGSSIAVVEGGYNPPALSVYHVPDLARSASVALPGAFGRPVWLDGAHVLVAGANADALLEIDVTARTVRRIAMPKNSYPIYVAAAANGTVAVATDGDGAIRIGSLAAIGSARPIAVGAQPGGLAFDATGANVYATSRTANAVVKIAVASGALVRRRTGLHPSAVVVAGAKVYVAQSDADDVGVYDAGDLRLIRTVDVGDGRSAGGVSPNALSDGRAGLVVSLGAANEVAAIRDDRVAERMPAGWYPTDALVLGNALYVLDGKGEGSRPNPLYRPGNDRDYIGTIEFGSLRSYPLPNAAATARNPQGATGWNAMHAGGIVRAGGPIGHVFFVLKENRSYDQVLGDVAGGNGDASLTRFGRNVTPNEHALARRFGLFDNAYTSGEVSVPGHMWSEAAFANDYVERFWPPLYAGRYNLDDISSGDDDPRVPAGGFLWDAAARAHVSFRDYGEQTGADASHPGRWLPGVRSLRGRVDALYPGWSLDISDLVRAKEWQRDLTARIANGTVPQLEFVWLPGDHTYGTKPGKLAPESYVAVNDVALGRMIDALSHSSVWRSSVMFVIEDDSQDGPDHVSDQRTTLFVVSPYARGGVRHEHYSTLSVLRTLELMLGMHPLSLYDATAVPMDAAFTSRPNFRPYSAIPAIVDVTRRNAKFAYGASQSARIDFSRPDAAPPGILERILSNGAASRH